MAKMESNFLTSEVVIPHVIAGRGDRLLEGLGVCQLPLPAQRLLELEKGGATKFQIIQAVGAGPQAIFVTTPDVLRMAASLKVVRPTLTDSLRFFVVEAGRSIYLKDPTVFLCEGIEGEKAPTLAALLPFGTPEQQSKVRPAPGFWMNPIAGNWVISLPINGYVSQRWKFVFRSAIQ